MRDGLLVVRVHDYCHHQNRLKLDQPFILIPSVGGGSKKVKNTFCASVFASVIRSNITLLVLEVKFLLILSVADLNVIHIV